MGLVWSVPLSFKGNDRESPKKGGGETHRRLGGPKTFLGRGFSPNLRYVFHPAEFSTPLGRSLRSLSAGNSLINLMRRRLAN